MQLILVESPTKTKTINKFLGKEYKVLASGGHIRDLPKNKMGIDIENNFEPDYIIPPRAKKNIKILKEAVKNAEKIYLATDPDREGEAISFHLTKALQIKSYERVSFNEITATAIKSALQKPRKIDMNLVDAQQARRVLDRLVGYKLSPFLWKKVARGLSAGRVQSAALRIIVDREKEIEKFITEEYWSIHTTLLSGKNPFSAELKEIEGKRITKIGIKNEEEAERIEEDLKNSSYSVKKIEKKERKKSPHPPFTTSTMQQEAFNKMRYSSKQTMSIAQKLYEKGLITYHRTDSLHLSTDSKRSAEELIINTLGREYYKERSYSAKGRTQEAHEAIRPAYPNRKPDEVSDLTDQERKLYDLIWRRFIASQMEDARFHGTKIKISAEKYGLEAQGVILLFDGFTSIYKIKFEDEELPEIKEGEEVTLKEVNKKQHFTKPPARFTEASLIKELEKHGIGRPSTYAPIISTLTDRNYIEKIEKRNLKPNEIGVIVSNLLAEHFSSIVDLKFTAKMEDDLDKVANGEKQWQPLIADFYKNFEENLKIKDKEIKKEDIMEEKTEEKCDKCGSEMVIKTGRYGKFLACKGYPECKNTKPLEEEEEEEVDPCEECGSPMKIKRSKFGEFYGCTKYPECKNIRKKEKKTGDKCPKCKEGDVVEKRSKRGSTFYGCTRYPDCDFLSNKKITEEDSF